MDNDTKMAEGAAATSSAPAAAPAAPPAARLLDPAIFDFLKSTIEEDQKVRDDLTQIIQTLERATSHAQGLLSRVHGTPRAQYGPFLAQVEASIRDQIDAVAELNAKASQYPYYK